MPFTPTIHSRLPRVGTTIFTVMSALAQEHGAVNLGQGFPDWETPAFVKEALASAVAAALEEGGGSFLGLATGTAVEEEGHGDVLHEVEGGDEVELLEDEADVAAPERGDVGLGERVESGAEDGDVAFVPREGAGGDGEEGGLAAAGGADDEVELAEGGGEGGVLEGEGAGVAGAEGLADVGELDGVGHGAERGKEEG